MLYKNGFFFQYVKCFYKKKLSEKIQKICLAIYKFHLLKRLKNEPAMLETRTGL